MTRVFKSERGKRRGVWSANSEEDLAHPLLVLKTEGATGQGMWAAFGTWKRQENRFSPRGSSERDVALWAS